ncbi:prepilin-type N-terminal cleavage/methylation domain-containing protein, partial [Vibrio owensii]
MKNKVGFTLIEVVIVIVILGIITAIAAPRFFNLQTDARNAALTALAASIETAGEFVFTKAVLQGKETALSESIQVGGETIELVYGYPVETFSNLAKVVDGLGGNNSKWKECNRG